MSGLRYRLAMELWLHPGQGGWHFLTIPEGPGREIRSLVSAAPGWGSLRVRVTIGATTWTTSIFPDAKSGSYLLPVKASVRQAEGLVVGATVDVRLEVLT